MNKSINKSCQVWWCTPVIPAFRRLRQEDGESQASLGYTVRPNLKSKPVNKSWLLPLALYGLDQVMPLF
jgi:hypothetical protein